MNRLHHARAYIRVRVTAVAAVAMLLATVAGSVLFLVTLRSSLEAGLVSNAREEIAAIAAQLADGASPQQVAITGRGDVVVQLVGHHRRVIASDHRSLMRRPLLTSPGTVKDMRVPGQPDLYSVVARRLHGNASIGLVVVGRSTEQADRARTVALLLLAVAVPVVVGLLAVTVWIAVGRALRPVEAMRREADAITSAHLDRRLAVPPGDDEIPRLAVTLNEMLDRIDQSQRLQRQFVSDASHELRSPLAVIRQSAEVARSYPDRVSGVDLAGDVLVESRRLENLVSALLLLARLDDSRAAPDVGVVDIDDLVLQEVARVRAVSDRVAIDISHVSGGQVQGSRVLLAQVVRNLVDNAVRHASSKVAVSLHEWDGHVQLYVDDDGAGIPPEDRERVFDRFVRLDEGRAREEGGSGLGLAIVRKIVELSGGSVSLGASPLGGARFSVLLPAAG